MTQPEAVATKTREASAGGPSGRRRVLRFAGLSLLLTVAMVVADVIALGLGNRVQALSPHYYMALGDSLSFGYQPNLDFSAGFADVIFNDLHKTGVSALVNYACAGETTQTMIDGGCVGRFAHKGSYLGPQLQAAVDFLSKAKNRGRVSPITLEIGANDVLPDWDAAACSADPAATVDLATMDANLTHVIFPALVKALGPASGDLHLLNYYNPFARACPESAPFIDLVNSHLKADAGPFRISVIDVYNAFGGDTGTAKNICDLTWYCSVYHDIHPTNDGYKIIARTVENALGLPGAKLRLGYGAPVGAMAPRIAAVWRRTPLG
ncbi:MAG TPA: SGNH/GDSL hydrolase family protein [Ktedonobacterales bacterium]|nr:SGNH/GDSL hydrolase family protein [Ktedonobacterales bacterium]